VTETVEVATAAAAALAAASPAAEPPPDQLFTLTPSRWPDADRDCSAFLHEALRLATADHCPPVTVGNIDQMEAAVKNIKVLHRSVQP